MKRHAPKRFGYTLLLIVLIALVSLHPFLYGISQQQMPMTDDGNLHLYRIIALDHALTYDHPIYPRYASSLALGYGAPLFNFFPPLAYFVPRMLHTLGMTFISAWHSAMMLYILLGVWGMYRLALKWTNVYGAMVAAASFAYAPYILFDTTTRGTLTEVAALAVLPHVLAAFTTTARISGLWSVLWAGITFGVFVPVHNIVTVHGTLLLMAYSLFLVFQRREGWRKRWLCLMCAGVFGLCLSAFFWLPALGETSQVKINSVTQGIRSLDVTRHLRPLAAVLQPPTTADTSQLNYATPITVSWLSLLAACLGLVLTLRQRHLVGMTLFCATVSVFSIFMNTPHSATIWKTVPLLNYTQYAWRVLGINSITLSLGAGIGICLLTSLFQSERARQFITAGFYVLIVLYGISWLYRPYQELQAEHVLDAQQYEYERGELALSSFSEYLPIWQNEPLDFERMQSRWEAGNYPIERLNHEHTTVNVIPIRWHGTSAELEVNASKAGVVVLDWLYMPQWQAYLDGEPIGISPLNGTGILSIEVPEGQHRLLVTLEASTLQIVGTSISGLSLLFALCLVFLTGLYMRHRMPNHPVISHITLEHLSAIAAISVALLLVKSVWFDTTDTLFHSKQIPYSRTIVMPNTSAAWNKEIELIGIKSVETHEDTFYVTSFWQLIKPTGKDYSIRYTVSDDLGNIITQADSFYPAELATSNWREGFYLEEQILIPIPAYTPPASYTLSISIYDSSNLALVPIYNATGNPEGVEKTFPALLKVSHLVQETYPAPLQEMTFFNLAIESTVPSQVSAGQAIDLSMLVEVPQSCGVYDVWLAWIQDKKTTVSAKHALNTCPSDYAWQHGDVWRYKQTFFVNGSLSAGEYNLSLGISDGTSVSYAPIQQAILVNEPIRTLEKPNIQVPLDDAWVNGIRLLGYGWAKESNTLSLYWRTTQEISENLRVFVHMVDEDQILEVHDEIPNAWLRPTTSWSVEEFVTTNYAFKRKDGKTFLVGWYNERSGVRVHLTSGEDVLRLRIR